MVKKSLSYLLFVFFAVSSFAQVQWPPVTQTAKPWTRWWWEGSAVNKTDLTWNLEQYRNAGLGGVEITPIYGIHGYEKEFIDFLSAQWMQMLVHTLDESKRLELGVDLANATGWPFGGPWVSDQDASKSVYYKTYSLNEGERLNEPVEYRQKAFVRTANGKPAAADTILEPPSRNKNLQSLALDQIQYPGKLPLQCLMAYGEDGSVLDLTGKVGANGNLEWTAPPGKWNLYALFEGLHGKMVERAAPGGEGYAIDHFSAEAVHHYFKKFDEAFQGYDLSYLRGFFNDSYEVDDAMGQANWTDNFLAEFKKRKGYDLKEQLPALFGKAEREKNSRVLYDYRSVIDELILEDFTKQWKKWADGKGKIVRNQSHGSPANTLDLYSVVDIPETEGNDILRFKFATSAANVTGKKLVSSESATWLNEHFVSSWGEVKKAIDLYFLGGVNHIFYHGTAYSPKNVPWPGWLFYAAVHFQPVNPQWKDFHVLNEYIARVQSFLQEGRPDNDILLYYPIVDRYTQAGNTLLQHFDGMERNFEKTDFENVSAWMLENGYSFDFFSDRQLQSFSVSGNKISTGGNSYQCILLPANKYIPAESMKKLMELAQKGATVLFYKDLPQDVPGLSALEKNRALLKEIKSGLRLRDLASGIRVMQTEKGGRFAAGNDLDGLFYQFNIRQETMIEKGVQFLRRSAGEEIIYFICNTTTKNFNGWVTLQSPGESVVLYDPMTKNAGLARVNHKNELTTDVRLQLLPGESCILRVSPSEIKSPPYPYYQADSAGVQNISGQWQVEFLDGGPVLPPSFSTPATRSWTEAGEDAENFSGTAKYSIHFKRPKIRSAKYLLDLGEVHETAEIFLNGKRIATLIGPQFKTVISAGQLKKKNKLEVVVANLMANRIAWMDKKAVPWKIFYNTNMPARKRENSKNGLFDASSWDPLPSGLTGPVKIYPLKPEE